MKDKSEIPDGHKQCESCGESFPACDMIETIDDMGLHGWSCDECFKNYSNLS